MGFDVLYLPADPSHRLHERKGAEQHCPAPGKDDPGSPWAIGGEAGGPQIDPSATRHAARFQAPRCARGGARHRDRAGHRVPVEPDHPYVREHPEWVPEATGRTIQYAENPPKKYQDIYPFHFETDAWRELWEELKSVFDFWIEQGVRIFRVDNPHTKPFRCGSGSSAK
jgi:starch synthase (maltosyl-transferring)